MQACCNLDHASEPVVMHCLCVSASACYISIEAEMALHYLENIEGVAWGMTSFAAFLCGMH